MNKTIDLYMNKNYKLITFLSDIFIFINFVKLR